MLRISCVGLIVLFMPAVSSADSTWRVVADDSKIEFVGSKPDGKHAGGFKKMTAVADVADSGPQDSKVTIEIDTASLFSDDEKLTTHLKSPDFFDVRQYPKIKFVSTKITEGDAEGSAKIVGDLTLLKVTKSIEIDVQVKMNPDTEQVELTTEFEIDRTAFGMTYGEGKINNGVKIKALLKFKKED